MPNAPGARGARNLALARAKRSTDPTLALRIADYVRTRQGGSTAAEAFMQEIIADRQILFYHQVLDGHDHHVYSIAFSPNGRELVTTGSDHTVRYWHVDGRRLFSTNYDARSATFSPDGRFILTCDRHRGLLLDLQGASEAKSHAVDPVLLLPEGDNMITSVTFSPDGQLMLTGDRDGAARLFDRQGREHLKVYGDAHKVWSVAFHPDGRHFLTGNYKCKATLWSTAGERIRDFPAQDTMVLSVAISPGGQRILTGSRDKTVRLWDLEGNELLRVPRDLMPVQATHSLTFSPVGDSFLTSDRECIATWYDLAGKRIATLPGDGGCNAIAFSPDGRQIATGGWDRKVRLWAIQSREETGLNVDTFLEKFVYDFTPAELISQGLLPHGEEHGD